MEDGGARSAFRGLASSRVLRRLRLARLKEWRADDFQSVQPVSREHSQCREPVFQAAAEVDARSLGEVADGDGDVAESEAERDRLRQELAVEHEIIRIPLERNRFEDLSRI